MQGEGKTQLPAWVGSALTAALLAAVLFAAAVASDIGIPVWVGWALAAAVSASILVSGVALARRAR